MFIFQLSRLEKIDSEYQEEVELCFSYYSTFEGLSRL